jgi:hypothetical protein
MPVMDESVTVHEVVSELGTKLDGVSAVGSNREKSCNNDADNLGSEGKQRKDCFVVENPEKGASVLAVEDTLNHLRSSSGVLSFFGGSKPSFLFRGGSSGISFGAKFMRIVSNRNFDQDSEDLETVGQCST